MALGLALLFMDVTPHRVPLRLAPGALGESQQHLCPYWWCLEGTGVCIPWLELEV